MSTDLRHDADHVAHRRVRVLEADGRPVKGSKYPSELTPEDHVRLLSHMMVTRRLDREFVNLQRQGELALFPPSLGQEAAQVGTAFALRDDDWMFPQYRELGCWVVRGIDPAGLGHMWRGDVHGGIGFIERCCAPLSIPIGTHALHAVGYAMGIQRDRSDGVAVAYIGDGATSEGDVHEAMNIAGVFGAPCIFVVQNNQWAISVPLDQQTRVTALANKADAYGMPGVQCDGNDVLACWSAMHEAVTLARSGGGPTLIEAVTFRMGPHTTSDDPTRYQTEAQLKEWGELDPIERYRRHLTGKKAWSDDDQERAERTAEEAALRLRTEIFGAAAPDPLALFDQVLAVPSRELERQRRQLSDELARNER